MFVSLEDGTQLRGDFVLRMVQRFDLTPIPSTLELTIRTDSSVIGKIADGTLLIAGTQSDRYRIVKTRSALSEAAQGRDNVPTKVLEATCILDGFTAMAKPLPRAVFKESKSMGEVYRSCGATVRVGDDIPVSRFACVAGQFPTISIARVLQEEAAAAVWSAGGKVSFKRLADLFTGEPVERLATDSTQVVESSFLEQHELPWALSTSKAGEPVLGNRDQARWFIYLPRADVRVLNNMTRCLMVRRTMNAAYSPSIRAGDGIDIAGVRHVVVTVAHTVENGDSGAESNQTTRMWLAQLKR